MSYSLADVLSIGYVSTHGTEVIEQIPITGFSTDSRTFRQGDCFVAIRGESFDGHAFVNEARSKGATCAIVDERFDVKKANLPLIIVKDTAIAYGRLARLHRLRFTLPVIAVAGSNGKTTTKEMITAVLSRSFAVISTEGNLNNHIGVPQTLFRLGKEDEIAVVEIGTNHTGELAYLCDILRPTHGVITNIGHEHLEFFRTLDGVERAEGELFTALGTRGTGFVNTDDPRVLAQAKKLRRRVTYGTEAATVAVKGDLSSLNARGCAKFQVRRKGKRAFPVSLNVPGMHAMNNALAAVTIGLHFGVPVTQIQSALSEFRAVSKRMEVVEINGVIVINDTYNANADSMISALNTLGAMTCSGKKVAVLADMLELGSESQKQHTLVGKAVASSGAEYLLTFGTMAKAIHDAATVPTKFHYDQKNVLSEYAAELLLPGDILLVKGSRGMKMEDVVTFLQLRLGRIPGGTITHS
jgi:UDP-N-acetylmuramoyl-tripeptide--D-alanyl-D-alanine ligase